MKKRMKRLSFAEIRFLVNVFYAFGCEQDGDRAISICRMYG